MDCHNGAVMRGNALKLSRNFLIFQIYLLLFTFLIKEI